MKRLGVLLLIVTALSVGCKEEEDTFDEVAQYQADLELIDQYIADNAITDTLHHETGIRYKIVEAGDGIQARVGDKLRVSYEGRLLENDEVFDSSEQFDFVLNSGSVILGWYYMCQEMQEGDTFTVYLPSVYGYGQSGSGSAIPPNATLIFDITLIRVGE